MFLRIILDSKLFDTIQFWMTDTTFYMVICDKYGPVSKLCNKYQKMFSRYITDDGVRHFIMMEL